MRNYILALAVFSAAASAPLQGQASKRAITLDDHSRIIGVGDPQRSPDGQWVAYTVTTIDADKDRRNTDIWMIKWDGSEQLQLTSSPGRRVVSSLEPGQQVPRLRRITRHR